MLTKIRILVVVQVLPEFVLSGKGMKRPPLDVFGSLDSKTRSAVTRCYNAQAHKSQALAVALQAPKKAKKRKAPPKSISMEVQVCARLRVVVVVVAESLFCGECVGRGFFRFKFVRFVRRFFVRCEKFVSYTLIILHVFFLLVFLLFGKYVSYALCFVLVFMTPGCVGSC